MEKQKQDQITRGAPYNPKKKNLYVNNTSQGKAMAQWAQRGEIPIEASLIKVRGGDGNKRASVSNEVTDTAAHRFIKKLIVEENMHLVRMSSKSGNGLMNTGVTIQKFSNRINNKIQ